MNYTVIKVQEVKLEISAGAGIGTAIHEAALYAMDNNLVTTFVFNEREYRVDPQAIVSFIHGQHMEVPAIVEAPAAI